MTKFAIIAGGGTVENIVVANLIEDVFVPAGMSIKPVDVGAEIGGTYDGLNFVPIPLPPPSLVFESVERESLRILAEKIDSGSNGATAALNMLLGTAP